jgi:hypothetical protein
MPLRNLPVLFDVGVSGVRLTGHGGYCSGQDNRRTPDGVVLRGDGLAFLVAVG